jgi:hypothetical protein
MDPDPDPGDLKTYGSGSDPQRNTGKGTLRQMFICLRPPPLLGFCLGRCSNFVGSESGQKQSVKLLQNGAGFVILL